MKKLLVVLFWSFMFRHPLPIPGAYAVTMVGPFASEAMCVAQFEDAQDILGQFPGMEFRPCIETKGA